VLTVLLRPCWINWIEPQEEKVRGKREGGRRMKRREDGEFACLCGSF